MNLYTSTFPIIFLILMLITNYLINLRRPYQSLYFRLNDTRNQMESQQKSPIHHRLKPEPFFNASKRRRLSLSNHTGKDNQIIKQHNFFVNRIRRKKKPSVDNNSDTLENNYIQIQLMRDQQKGRAKSNNKNLLAFFPTYTTLVDNQMQNMYFHKTLRQKQEIVEKIENKTILQDPPSQRQRLAPLRKIKKQQNQAQDKGNLNISFFNIQKLSLVPVIPQKNNDSRNKLSFTAAIIDKRTISPRQSLDQSKTIQIMNQLKQEDNKAKNPVSVRSSASKTFTNMKNEISVATRISRPFIPPFQRYHYFDFLWKISYSNGIKTEFVENLPKKYKVYIGSGNNSMLLKTFFKRRQSWWTITQKIDEATFVWTQIKVNSIHMRQKNRQSQIKNEKKSEEYEKKKKNGVQIKKNMKILNNRLLENWVQYFEENKQIEQKLNKNFSKRNKLLKMTNFGIIDTQKIKIHNHFPRNYILGNKKALFATMKKYYQLTKQEVFHHLPLTFHIENGLEDKQYFRFLQFYYKRVKELKESEKSGQKLRNIWIVKPGQFTNRGNGIIVCRTLEQIKSILKNKKKLDNGNNRTYIVQQYLDRPFLYYRRKFDIRHYMLITCINGHIKGYWYQLGYIRTTSYQYSVKNSFSSVHLTNDAVQKHLPDYGKYEKGNKLSYEEFQKYLQKQYQGKYSFYSTIYPQMKKIALDSMRASALFIDTNKKQHNFEVFGFDFMIDSHFHPWLIQINTNPCLELSSPVLMDVIPDMIENTLKIAVDSILPPPYSFTQKRPRFSENILETNKFQLLYDSCLEEQKLAKIFSGTEELKLNHKELQKDEDQVYEDDGIQLQD